MGKQLEESGRPGGWIGVDLDGTLAHYGEWQGITHIGEPILDMVERVRNWLAEGKDVRIFTARVGPQRSDVAEEISEITNAIETWCIRHIGMKLPVTCQKDFGMVELWDDRAIQVKINTGARIEQYFKAEHECGVYRGKGCEKFQSFSCTAGCYDMRAHDQQMRTHLGSTDGLPFMHRPLVVGDFLATIRAAKSKEEALLVYEIVNKLFGFPYSPDDGGEESFDQVIKAMVETIADFEE